MDNERKAAVPGTSPIGGSRQSRYQHRRHAEGKCWQCGQPVVDGWRCAPCREKKRTNSRNFYRKKHGIPLNAKKLNPGRPRAA